MAVQNGKDLLIKVDMVGDGQFQTLAGVAKANCPVSRLFKAEISLDATLT